MIKTNGLNSADPDYNDFGFSDFECDYVPSDEQIEDWFTDDPFQAIEAIKQYSNGIGILHAAWIDTHQSEIENEWEAKQDD